MKIVVCLKEIIDPALNLDFGLENGVVFREGRPLKLNPSDAAALALALEVKAADSRTAITAISIGPARVEGYLRNALSLGADMAVRLPHDAPEELSPHHKALLLAKAAEGADLILTGSRSLDTANSQVGPLLAARLGLPCILDTIDFALEADAKSITLRRDVGRGEREKLRCPLPAVLGIKGVKRLPYAPLDAFLKSRYREITLLTPDGLGVTPETLKAEPARVNRLVFPRPPLVKAPPLDSSLPAFYRILQLLEGGIARREGRRLEGTLGEVAEKLYRLLIESGVLKPAKEGN